MALAQTVAWAGDIMVGGGLLKMPPADITPLHHCISLMALCVVRSQWAFAAVLISGEAKMYICSNQLETLWFYVIWQWIWYGGRGDFKATILH